MERKKYIFTYENRANAKEKRFATLQIKEASVYRGEFNEILERTDIEIAEELSTVYNVTKRVSSNVAELQNGDRISWQIAEE